MTRRMRPRLAATIGGLVLLSCLAAANQDQPTAEQVLARLDAVNLPLAIELASVPEMIRGFGHVKARHLVPAKTHEAELLERWRNPEAAKPRPTIPIRAAA